MMKNNIWKIYNPTKIIFGPGSISELRSAILNYPLLGNVLLICGRKALKQSGYLDKVIKMLSGRKVTLLDKVEPNPGVGFVDEAIKLAGRKRSRLVVGLGGGSVIDTAKVVALLAGKGYSLAKVLAGDIHIRAKGLVCIVIPTTAGTGSEVTKTSSIWDKDKQAKLTMCSDEMFPDVAIVDPNLTLSLSNYQTAVTGLDALSHAIESYWSKKAFAFTRDFSLQAASLIFKHIKRAFKQPENLPAREGMSLASLYAGLAISNTGTTAAHSISYILTARFGVTHGLACAISLPHLIRHNIKTGGRPVDKLALAAGFKNANQLAEGVGALLKAMRLPAKLRECGVSSRDIELIKRRSYFTSNMSNNSFRLTQKDLKSILEKML